MFQNAYFEEDIAPIRKSHQMNLLHRLFHKSKKMVACPFCKAQFAEKIELVIHIRNRHWLGRSLDLCWINSYNQSIDMPDDGRT